MNRIYQPTDASAAAARKTLGAMGITRVPGPRKRKPTVDERVAAEVLAWHGPRQLLRGEQRS